MERIGDGGYYAGKWEFYYWKCIKCGYDSWFDRKNNREVKNNGKK